MPSLERSSKLRKPFSSVRKLKKTFELSSNIEQLTGPQLVDMVEQLQRRLAQVQDYSLNITIRSIDEINSCTENELRKLKNLTNKSDLMYYVNYRYTPDFFYNEPDTTYKIYLCNKLVDYLKSVVPNFTNSLIEGIAQNTIEHYEYIKNPILEG